MKAVDTNVLVYAEITISPQHLIARDLLRQLTEGPRQWAIPWPCVYEFLLVITHPRVYHPPLSPENAMQELKTILSSPSLLLLSETAAHVATLEYVIQSSGAKGSLIHDAHIVALCLEHGVSELFTADRDFTRFSGLKITNPFAN
jgi:uncharacterized protein